MSALLNAGISRASKVWTRHRNRDHLPSSGARVLWALLTLCGVSLWLSCYAAPEPEEQLGETHQELQARWTPRYPMNVPRALHTATYIPSMNRVLVTGGTMGSTIHASTELYNPGDGRWTQAKPMNTPRVEHTATLLKNGMVLVTGGWNISGILKSAQLYNPNTQDWTQAPDMQVARYHHTATLLDNGKVLVVGGINSSSQPERTAEIYDPSPSPAGIWSSAGMTQGRTGHSAVAVSSGNVLVAGGTSPGLANQVEEYQVNTGQWIFRTIDNNLHDMYSESSAVWVPDLNGVLFTGGLNSSGVSISTEAIPVFPGPTRYRAPLITPRSFHTTTVLPDGYVLVVGGQWTSSAEAYVPEMNKWVTAGSMTTLRERHTATDLGNGQVLIAGGYSDGVTSLASTETVDLGLHGSSLGLVVGNNVALGNTCGANDMFTPSATCTRSSAPEISYHWAAPYSGSFTFDIKSTYNFDSVLEILDGFTGASLGCNDDKSSSSVQSSLKLSLAAGQYITIVIDGYLGYCGDFSLNISYSR